MSLIVLAATKKPRQPIAGGRGFRAPNEFYPTPPEAVRALLSVETFDGPIWEPACGDGAIAKVLTAAGHQVVCTDLVSYGYGLGGVDFFDEKTARAKHIVTNPPYGYGLADRFAKHALALANETGGTVAMLLNLSSLCHRMRHDWYVNYPPAAIYALDELTCYPCGDPKLATASTAKHRYCWLVWKPGHTGRPSFWWLSATAFRTQ